MIYNFDQKKIKIHKNGAIKSSRHLKICMMVFNTSKLINYILIINFSTNFIFNVDIIAKLFK